MIFPVLCYLWSLDISTSRNPPSPVLKSKLSVSGFQLLTAVPGLPATSIHWKTDGNVRNVAAANAGGGKRLRRRKAGGAGERNNLDAARARQELEDVSHDEN